VVFFRFILEKVVGQSLSLLRQRAREQELGDALRLEQITTNLSDDTTL